MAFRFKGQGRPRAFTTRQNKGSLISITGSPTNEICTGLSQPAMSITHKIQNALQFQNFSPKLLFCLRVFAPLNKWRRHHSR